MKRTARRAQGGQLQQVSPALADLLHRAGERAFRADDEAARQRGWQVAERRAGLARVYRDPRFDTLRACGDCAGSGEISRLELCPVCGGTGRIRIGQRAEIGGRQQ